MMLKTKRQAIETILQTRINKDKAKIIADVIARTKGQIRYHGSHSLCD